MAPAAPKKPPLRAMIALAAEGGDTAIVEELRSNPSYRTAPADVVHQLLVRSGVESGRAEALMDEADLSRDGARSASAAAAAPAAPAAPATPTRRSAHARRAQAIPHEISTTGSAATAAVIVSPLDGDDTREAWASQQRRARAPAQPQGTRAFAHIVANAQGEDGGPRRRQRREL